MYVRKLLFFLLIIIGGMVTVWGTHQRAGEITYRHISGLTYEFTLITYTYTPSPADRPEIEIFWGDETSDIVERNEKSSFGTDITLNKYVARHTFPASGQYSVTFEDPNRNSGVVNIPNSVNIPFFLETIITINPFLGDNNSLQLLNPPIDNGCTNVPFYHNPGAYDPDGDSLSYKLIPCRGYDGVNVPGYSYPAASNVINIDPITGNLTWDSPMMTGEYNIAILIEEWRYGILIGSVVRDMQIQIAACNNTPPEIITIEDTCVTAGDLLVFDVTVTDNLPSVVTLSATGEPFLVDNSKARFDETIETPPFTKQFSWNTICEHVRTAPYQVLFKAIDNGPHIELSRYKTVNITVVCPKPEELTVTPVGNEMHLEWMPSVCSNVAGYDIYKRRGSNPFEPDYCETGMPPDKGYELIGTVDGHRNTTFIDDGSVIPLNHNNEYCYRIVAFFANGAESYVSDEVCKYLFSDAPMITHVDVEETDTIDGVIHIRWVRPPEIDTIRFPGPYQYVLKRASSEEIVYEEIFRIATLEDTSFTDTGLNTSNFTYYYKVELYNLSSKSADLIEVSDPASSVFINIQPMNRAIKLVWDEQVPWTNLNYVIYKQNEFGNFDSLASTAQQFYVDQYLENGETYCYYIRSEGGYFFPDTIYPLLNRSQRNCAIPIDDLPPDIPNVTMTTDCELVTIEWMFNSDTSYHDVFLYTIYYKPTYDAPFTEIESFYSNESVCFPYPCSRTIQLTGNIVGCIGMTLTDAYGNISEMTEITCFDYDECWSYRLPNIFTPNGDAFNDLFIPFPYRNVEKIDMVIHNRWGKIVFKTTDPDIHWDGHDQLTNQPCTDGIYYYACDVYLQSLLGTITKRIHGAITIRR